jgi:NAD(P)-dependent dehydrogenase (short-subunit alcohol dehydrogenase family)
MTEPVNRPVALVTGAAQGIGRGIARRLGEAGYDVALGDIDEDPLFDTEAELQALGVDAQALLLDVTRADDWTRVLGVVAETWGRLDLLVNNAGVSSRGSVTSTSEDLWHKTLDVNLKGAWLGIKASLPLLREGGGSIVNIGSTRSTRPMAGLFPYVVSKAGLLGLTRQVAVECLLDGVTCNMVAPGWVDTPNERKIQARYGRPDFPAGLRNLTTPDEVGAAVVFLASPAGRKINGIILYLDAGLHVADDAGMVYLPDRTPPYAQRLDPD